MSRRPLLVSLIAIVVLAGAIAVSATFSSNGNSPAAVVAAVAPCGAGVAFNTHTGAPCPAAVLPSYTFTRTLKIGSTGPDVKALQQLLNTDPATQVATKGPGSPGLESTYYGPATASAVSKFQLEYKAEILTPLGLTKPTGTVGASTIKELNLLESKTTTVAIAGCTPGAAFSTISGRPCTTLSISMATSTQSRVITITDTRSSNGTIVPITISGGGGGGGGGGSSGGGGGSSSGGGGSSAPTTYSIVVAAGANGSASAVGTLTPNAGDSPTVSFVADDGYQIDTVTLDGSSIGSVASYTFQNVSANHTISATFKPKPTQPTTYTINASAGANGTVTPSGITTVTSGGTQSYTIAANSGYQIASVTVDGSSVGSPTTYPFPNISANHTISATFTSIPVTTYTITASAGSHGTISPTGPTKVNAGSSATFTFNPANSYQVNTLTVDGQNVTNPTTSYTFPNVAGAHTIAVTFSKIPVTTYTITASAGPNGSISPGTTQVTAGTSKTFTFAAATGYQVASVLVDNVNQGAISSYTFPAVSATHTISVTFVAQTFTITTTAGPNGTISPSGIITVASGANQSLAINPNTGYQIASVTVDGQAQIPPGGTVNLTSILTNHTVSATFSPLVTYTLTTNAVNGTITKNPNQSVFNAGDVVTLTASPNSGYQFSSWSGAVTGSTNPTTLTMNANSSVTANFTAGSVATPLNTWDNHSFSAQTGTFTATFDAVSGASANTVIGLSAGSAAAYTDLAPIVAFQTDGTINARNGSSYAAASTIPYTPGQTYHFRLVVNVATHTYDSYVTPPGGTETPIGIGYAFRTEQASVASLANVADFSTAGGVAISNFTIASGGQQQTPAPTVNFSAASTFITSGTATTLTWSSTNATSCTASGGWSGSKATSGSQSTGNLTTSTTYTLSCTGTGGTTQQSTTVTVATSGGGGTTTGWTTVTQNADDQVIYVSSSSGLDSNNGTSSATPVKTIAHAESLFTTGHPVWLLLKAGDTWYEGTYQWKWAGNVGRRSPR